MSNLSDVAERITDSGDTNASVVITTGDGVSDIGGHISEDIDEHPVEPSLWMLALHIHHVRQSARDAGGDADAGDVVVAALERLNRSQEEGDGE